MLASSLWIFITLAAALIQSIRTAMQKSAVSALGIHGANFSRYLYGAPIAILLLSIYLAVRAASLPPVTDSFFLYCVIGGLAQIAATACLIASLTWRDMAVGTALSKTDAMQAALFSAVLLDEHLGLIGWIAIVVSFMGVALLSWRQLPTAALAGDLLARRGSWAGLGAGMFFGVSGVCFRGASLSVMDRDALTRALTTLSVTNMAQLVLFATALAFWRPAILRGTVAQWREAGVIGVLSIAGSALWFWAMSLQAVALVRVVGQAELIFAFLIARFGFREHLSMREITGIILTAGGVTLLLL